MSFSELLCLSCAASVTSAIVVVAALGEMICPVIVGNVSYFNDVVQQVPVVTSPYIVAHIRIRYCASARLARRTFCAPVITAACTIKRLKLSALNFESVCFYV